MNDIYIRTIKSGDKDIEIRQTVVAEEDDNFLVWFRDSEHKNLQCYWTDKETFLTKWNFKKRET